MKSYLLKNNFVKIELTHQKIEEIIKKYIEKFADGFKKAKKFKTK